MTTLTGENGKSAAQAIEAGVSEYGKEITREAMTVWNSEAQKRLMQAAGNRSDLDVQRDLRGALEGRESNALHELANEFTVPQWDEQEQAWVFAVTHAAAVFHEWGAMPHEIMARRARALAFEWPDAPEEIKEQFEDTFPTVFFNSVQHPGVPAIGYMRYGRQQAREELSKAGISTEAFSNAGGGE